MIPKPVAVVGAGAGSALVPTPRQKYVARVQREAINDQKMVQDLNTLLEMGFTDYDVNLALLKKYGDCAPAAEHICAHGTEGIL